MITIKDNRYQGEKKKTLGSTSYDRITKNQEEFTSLSNIKVPGIPNTSLGGIPINIDLNPLLTDISYNDQRFLKLYRDMYYFDPIAGSTVDLMSSLPFSEFTIGGIENKKVLGIFKEAIERLNVRTLLSELSIDFLVMGAFVGSLLYNRPKKQFFDIIPHDFENLTIERLPFYSQDPILTVRFPADMVALLSRNTPRIQNLRKKLGSTIIDKMTHGNLELDPVSTVYIPRKTFTTTEGVSYYKRLLPMYLIEKNLYRGTLVESSRRQRGILHLTMGDGMEWDPTPEDMEQVCDLFTNADADPLGAIIATRLGVSTEEIRSGGEFWRVTDMWEQTSSYKLRALGISEQFLCTCKDTLLFTKENGLKRISSLSKSKEKDKPVPIDLTLLGKDGQWVKATKWYYRGKAPVVRLTTKSGYNLKATPEHQVLVLTEIADTEYKKIENLKPTDYLCIDMDDKAHNKKLALNLPDFVKSSKKGDFLPKSVKKPIYMSQNLAYICGIIISEGYVSKNFARICNSDDEILSKFAKLVYDVFGVEVYEHISSKKGEIYSINGLTGTCKVDTYDLAINSKIVAFWLVKLGLEISKTKNGKLHSYYKKIPWSILQADRDSKLAFIAAYVDGDGHVNKNHNSKTKGVEIHIASRSDVLLRQMQILLLELGYHSYILKKYHRLIVPASHGGSLLNELRPYMAAEHKKAQVSGIPTDRYWGVPTTGIINFLKSRHLYREVNVGEWFKNDQDEPVLVKKFGGRTHNVIGGLKQGVRPPSLILRDSFFKGQYDDFLSVINQISPTLHSNLVRQMEIGYRFEQVASIKPLKKPQHLYDLSIESTSPPAFVANGIVIHNSGDATWNTMETSLTVFIESLRSYRDRITRRFFYNKLFPLISLINGLTVSKNGKLSISDNIMSNNSEDLLDILQDGSRLLIPSIHWSKQLKPEGDTNFIDLLEKLTGMGVPIPLRALAAAGGFNLDELLLQQDEDMSIRTRVADYVTAIRNLAGPPAAAGGEGGENYSESSNSPENNPFGSDLEKILASASPGQKTRSSVIAANGQKPLTARKFGNSGEVIGKTKTGKPKYVPNQKMENDRANQAIGKALVKINKERKTPLNSTTETPKKP